MKKITITGVSITGNRGAEAMLLTAIGRIRDEYPDALFNVFSIYPKIDKNLITDQQIKIFSSTPFHLVFILFPLSILLSMFLFLKLNSIKRFFPESIRVISDCNLMIDLSGVSFIDSRLKFIAYNILLILPGLLLGVPVIKGSQAMGPFNKKLNRISATLMLNKCTKIFARGKYTLNHFKTINVDPGKILMASDIAFLYKKSDSLAEENKNYLQNILQQINYLKDIQKSKIIGICPSSVVYSYSQKVHWNYIEFLNNITNSLIAKGYKVLLFPNATRENNMKQFSNNDLPVIRKIVEKNIANERFGDSVIFIDKNLNSSGIRSLIETLDVALISRFHAMIACLERSVPLLVIGWSHKYLEVMELFEMEEWAFDYRNNDENSLIEKILLLISHRPELSSIIMKKLTGVKKLSLVQVEYINKLLSKSAE